MARFVKISVLSSDFIILDSRERDTINGQLVLEYLDEIITPVMPDRPDLVVLPEVCDRPDNFEMPRRIVYYTCRGEMILDHLRATARENHCCLVYPTERLDEHGSWRNAAYLIDRSGEVRGVYDKMFVTLSQMREDGVACGSEAPLFRCDLGTVGMAICFDLNFPTLLGAYAGLKPDLIVFPSHFHGSFVAEYWAYASRAYVVGAIARNECYIVSPAGHTLARSTPGRRFLTTTINLDRCVVHCDWHELHKLDALKRAYGTGVAIVDPGFMGNFLVASESEGVSAVAMAREAGLTLLDDHVQGLDRAGTSWRGA